MLAEQHRHQRRLAGTVLAEQRQHLAARQGQRDRIVGQQAAEALADAIDAQHLVAGDCPGQRGAPGFGGLSSTFTTNLPSRIAFSFARTFSITSFGTLASNVPSGASSDPPYFIIEYEP